MFTRERENDAQAGSAMAKALLLYRPKAGAVDSEPNCFIAKAGG